MKKALASKRSRKGMKSFNPNREYLEQAVEDYMNKGGKITRIVEVDDADYEQLATHREYVSPADDFLLGS